MWERKEVKEDRPAQPAPSRPHFTNAGRTPNASLVNIGPSIFIKGELSGDEDLTIEGKVEGKIELKNHDLTIGSKGKIQAQVYANAITIKGDVTGNVFAKERVEISDTGRLTGDITSPRIVISDGAHFRGSVDMQKKSSESGSSDRTVASAAGTGALAAKGAAQPAGAFKS
jgi:cytoskeletal protein CcmA (bactofilin family)